MCSELKYTMVIIGVITGWGLLACLVALRSKYGSPYDGWHGRMCPLTSRPQPALLQISCSLQALTNEITVKCYCFRNGTGSVLHVIILPPAHDVSAGSAAMAVQVLHLCCLQRHAFELRHQQQVGHMNARDAAGKNFSYFPGVGGLSLHDGARGYWWPAELAHSETVPQSASKLLE